MAISWGCFLQKGCLGLPLVVVPAPQGMHSDEPGARVMLPVGQFWHTPPDGTWPAEHLIHAVLQKDRTSEIKVLSIEKE